ncbi:two-component system sensor histidine kinase NtrB [Desulfogranum mediterraneum]|uniref:two-component system sensor histidine kinase NtrB n=1 Tax=Desulfogranum mediterraneum TaxID=160661 RepID=UPI00048A4F56|nr:ATP-binding protein [Desulfogranum mediterraneum]
MPQQEQQPDPAERSIERLTETLKQLQYQHQMLLKWINVAVVEVDREGRIIEANQEALHILGWSREELVGLECHPVIHHTLDDGSAYPWEFCPLFAALEDGSSHHVDGDVFWKRDGSSFSADFIVCANRNEHNQISGAILTFRNITEQRLQEAKRVHNLKLQSIGELSAGIAHEINTPIQFIGNNLSFLEQGFEDLLQLLQEYSRLRKNEQLRPVSSEINQQLSDQEEEADLEYLLEEVPKAFTQTQHGVDRVRELVQGLKGFSHSSEETRQLTDLNQVINNTLIVCRNEYKYCAEVQLELGAIPEIEVFQGDMGQVILNLVVNAAHAIAEKTSATSEPGLITISSRADEDKVLITVSDDGAGIDPKIRERIFDPFFTTKDVGRGSGQGLAIARTIVSEKHGGTLSFDSVPGKGTTFTISLPRQAASPETQP